MEKIIVKTEINADIKKVWICYTEPKHVIGWNFATSDWETTKASSDFRVGGKFSYHMAAKDKSFGFDFVGTFTEIKPYSLIAFTLGDGRKVTLNFVQTANGVTVTETFIAEKQNAIELQRQGWQAILNHFKSYVETMRLKV